jgi:hypothetical protein
MAKLAQLFERLPSLSERLPNLSERFPNRVIVCNGSHAVAFPREFHSNDVRAAVRVLIQSDDERASVCAYRRLRVANGTRRTIASGLCNSPWQILFRP